MAKTIAVALLCLLSFTSFSDNTTNAIIIKQYSQANQQEEIYGDGDGAGGEEKDPKKKKKVVDKIEKSE